MAASCLGSMWPAWSPPKISRATSPGITRMIRKTRAAAPSSVGTIRSSRFRMYVRMTPSPAPAQSSASQTSWSVWLVISVLRQPDVLELLVRVVTGRRHVVLQLGPVHDVARPPEPRHVVRVLHHELLELDDHLLALGGVEGPRLSREQVVDPGVGEAAPVLVAPGDLPAEELSGVVHELDGRRDDQLEVPRVLPVREPGRRLEGAVLGLDPDLAPLLDQEHREVLVGKLHVAILQDDLQAVGVTGFGEEPSGLGATLLAVLPEARELLELGLRHRPFRAGTHQTSHVPQAGERLEHPARRVAIEAQREGLADADIVERLHGVVDRDAPLAGHGRRLDRY